MEKPPTYLIRLYEDGNVFYEGKEHVKVIGRKELIVVKFFITGQLQRITLGIQVAI